MKQVFSSYPDGFTGFALLMLRGSAVALLVAVLQSPHDQLPWLPLPAIVVAAAIVLGCGTRPAVVLCALVAAPILLDAGTVPAPLMVGQGLSLFGLLLLGPGAFSVDARLFGRRKISLPK